MYGMRMLGDRTPAFELAEGARVVGIEFPAKYEGEWAMGWHDGEYKSVPVDVLRLEVPGRGQVRMGAASGVEAVAKWRFAPKGKDVDWLRFDKGEVITNITWSSEEHWCWSGKNNKGQWGLFPQIFVDSNTVRELGQSERAGDRRGSAGMLARLAMRKGSLRPSSLAGSSRGLY
ncbi:hypothetical protein VDGD_21481 [Verticillium dahliae]|nr:hypothetical protein VDGD_21481 [Verticillium dahliae]